MVDGRVCSGGEGIDGKAVDGHAVDGDSYS